MQQNICFVGLGMMGYPMAANLRKAGYRLQVMDADAARLAQFCTEYDAVVAVGDELAKSDAVVLMLPDSNVVESVLLAPAGIAGMLKKGAVVIDMSSSDPVRSRKLGSRLNEMGLQYLDAPVSGGVKKAVAGTLSIMVGGDAAVIERWQGLFDKMGASTFLVGGAGCGHAMKALNNYLAGVALLSAVEALHAGQRFGLDPVVMTEVFNASTGRNGTTENKIKQFMLNRQFNGGFAMKLLAKDLGIATELGKNMGTPVRLGEVCRDVFASALVELGGNPDHTEIYRFLEREVDGAA